MRKLTFSEVEKLFKGRGYKLLETEYINCETKMKYQCPNHPDRELFITVDKLKQGRCCPYCSKVGKVTQKDAENAFSKLGYILIDTYKPNHTPLKYICPNHPDKETKMRYSQALEGVRCPYCVNNIKFDFEEVKLEFEKVGYRLLEVEYINNSTPMKYICPKHPEKIRYISLANLKKGKRCMMCSRGGENHHNWSKLITDEERDANRNISGYNAWRKSVYKKDNYKCLICGSIEHLCAHHLDGFVWCKEKRTDVKNGVTLCNECHIEFHRQYGIGDNTKGQFIEWVNEMGISLE